MRVALAKYKQKHIKIYIRKSKMRKKQRGAKFSHKRIVFVALRQHSQEREHARLGLASWASLPRQKLADMAINCGFYEVWQSAYLKFLVAIFLETYGLFYLWILEKIKTQIYVACMCSRII
jgi:hypothetical protein